VAISAINPSPEIFYVAELDRAGMYRRGILLFIFNSARRADAARRLIA
jgi:hypothetical protein